MDPMEMEIRNYIMVWATAIMGGCYCYKLSRVTTKGPLRLLLVLPVIFLFTTLPFKALTSFHLGTATFFYLAWLSNFKLLLFAFGVGPLPPLRNSLLHFLFTLLLPIKATNNNVKVNQGSRKLLGGLIPIGVKLLVAPCVILSYRYRQILPYPLVLALYCAHLYLGVEIILAISGALARLCLGLHLSPQFNAPLLTTSLQDFWGNRWNLMVSDAMRLTVYNPARSVATPLVGRTRAMVVGMLASFLVSGLMHELIYYHATRVPPTWEVTWFFVLHGACTAAEVMVKKAVSGKWRLHPIISGPLTLGFVVVTGYWLFFPQIFRNEVHEKVIGEYPIMVNLFKRYVINYWLRD